MRRIIILLAGVLGALPAIAQDVLLLRDAQEIRCKVEEIGQESVVYRNWGDSSGPQRRIDKKKLVCVTFANGEKETFVDSDSTAAASDYPWPTVSHPYAVGDLFEEGDLLGLVVHTTDDGMHGVIVSLDSRQLAWCDFYPSPYNKTHKMEIGCNDPDDGWRNQQHAEKFIEENHLPWDLFPAFAWCRMLGPGWYLPAKNEFHCLASFSETGQYPTNDSELYKMVQNLCRECELYGGTPYNPFRYPMISSTERTADSVWGIKPDREKGDRERDGSAKFQGGQVRAFHRF